VHTPVAEVDPESCAKSLGGAVETIGTGGVGEVVQAHIDIVLPTSPAPILGVRIS
jgi:hypothetical protein